MYILDPPPLFPFLPIPYPLPLSTPATQAISQWDLHESTVNDFFAFYLTQINFAIRHFEIDLRYIDV